LRISPQIPSIEQLWANGGKVEAVEAAHVDVDLVRIGARLTAR
jgi:hypothetical protein